MAKKSNPYKHKPGDVTKVKVDSNGVRTKYVKSKNGKITLLGPILPSTKKTRSPSRSLIKDEIKSSVKQGKKTIKAAKKAAPKKKSDLNKRANVAVERAVKTGRAKAPKKPSTTTQKLVASVDKKGAKAIVSRTPKRYTKTIKKKK